MAGIIAGIPLLENARCASSPPAFLPLRSSLQAADEQKDLAYSMGVKLGSGCARKHRACSWTHCCAGSPRPIAAKPELDAQRMEQLLDAHETALERNGQDMQKAIAAEKRFIALERGKYGVRELKDGVLVTELRAGSGAKPARIRRCG